MNWQEGLKQKKFNRTADLKFLRVNIGTRCISRFFGNCNNKIKTSMKITLHSMCVFHRFSTCSPKRPNYP